MKILFSYLLLISSASFGQFNHDFYNPFFYSLHKLKIVYATYSFLDGTKIKGRGMGNLYEYDSETKCVIDNHMSKKKKRIKKTGIPYCLDSIHSLYLANVKWTSKDSLYHIDLRNILSDKVSPFEKYDEQGYLIYDSIPHQTAGKYEVRKYYYNDRHLLDSIFIYDYTIQFDSTAWASIKYLYNKKLNEISKIGVCGGKRFYLHSGKEKVKYSKNGLPLYKLIGEVPFQRVDYEYEFFD